MTFAIRPEPARPVLATPDELRRQARKFLNDTYRDKPGTLLVWDSTVPAAILAAIGSEGWDGRPEEVTERLHQLAATALHFADLIVAVD